MNCKGLHCPGCGDGGGSIAVVLIVLAVIIAAIARPVAHAAGDVLRVAVDALEVAAIVVASVAGLAVLAVLGAVLWRARGLWLARRPARTLPAQENYSYVITGVTVLRPSERATAPREVKAPKVNLAAAPDVQFMPRADRKP